MSAHDKKLETLGDLNSKMLGALAPNLRPEVLDGIKEMVDENTRLHSELDAAKEKIALYEKSLKSLLVDTDKDGDMADYPVHCFVERTLRVAKEALRGGGER